MYRLGIVWKVCIQEASMVHLCQYSLMIESYPADFEAYSLKCADEQLSMCFLEFRWDPHLELIFFLLLLLHYENSGVWAESRNEQRQLRRCDFTETLWLSGSLERSFKVVNLQASG